MKRAAWVWAIAITACGPAGPSVCQQVRTESMGNEPQYYACAPNLGASACAPTTRGPTSPDPTPATCFASAGADAVGVCTWSCRDDSPDCPDDFRGTAVFGSACKAGVCVVSCFSDADCAAPLTCVLDSVAGDHYCAPPTC